MKKNLLISALLLLFLSEASDAHAQEKNKTILIPIQQEDTLVRYTWEIGTDLLWLIDKNILPATNIFIRKNLVTKNDRLTAIRLRFGLDLNKMDSSQIWNINPVKRLHISPFMRIGHEWQAQLDRFQLFYGVDLHLLYLYDFERSYNTIKDWEIEGKLNVFEFGPVGVFGIKYFLDSRISISFESSVEFLYETYRYKAKNFVFENLNTTKEDNSDKMNIALRSLYILNLNYHF